MKVLQVPKKKPNILKTLLNKCIILEFFEIIFNKNRIESTKTSLFSYILVTFAYSYAIKAG